MPNGDYGYVIAPKLAHQLDLGRDVNMYCETNTVIGTIYSVIAVLISVTVMYEYVNLANAELRNYDVVY